jgi:hypothetical protein
MYKLIDKKYINNATNINFSHKNPISTKNLNKLDAVLSSLSFKVSYALGTTLLACCLLECHKAGKKIGYSGQFFCGCSIGIVGTLACANLEERRKVLAVNELQNKLAEMDDLSLIDSQLVRSVSTKFGLDIPSKLNSKLWFFYDAYLSNMLPIDGQLKGHEVEGIKRFKESLGISDLNAAAVHIEYGRRINRLKSEVDNPKRVVEITKAFQKLIYVSAQVFGDKQHLLNWRKHFHLSDAQLEIAKRNFAKQLFMDKFSVQSESGLPAEFSFFAEIRSYCNKIGFDEKYAVNSINEMTESIVRNKLSEISNISSIQASDCDHSHAVSQIEWVLNYNRRLDAISKDRTLFSGLKPVQLSENSIDGTKKRSFEEIFKLFLEDRSKKCELSLTAEEECHELKNILGINHKDSDEFMSIVLQKAYKKALRDEFASGRLENASSKASVLNELCYRLGMSSDVALKINKEILKRRFEQFLEKGSLCDTEEMELTKLRLLLCIKKEVVSDFKREMCGRLYGLTIESFFKLGIYSISLKERELVRKKKFELRLNDDIASQIIYFEARKVLMQFVSTYRNKIKHHNTFKELRNIILFSNFMVSPILDDKQGNGEKNLISRLEQKGKRILRGFFNIYKEI